MAKKLPLHPLINQEDSPHYQEPDVSEDSTSAIERFEQTETVYNLMVWSRITKRKYDDPGRAIKGEQEKDIRKGKTYQNYYTMLRSLIIKDITLKNMIAKDAYNKLNIYWRYK
jgi:hypothetical protein